MTKHYSALVLGLLLSPSASRAISVFAHDFASPSSTTWSFGSGVPINTSVWSTYTNGNHGARITGGRLEITSRRNSSEHGQGFAYVACGGTGSQYNAVYNPVLSANPSVVTWTFNMRKPSPTTSTSGGFDCSSSASQNYRTIGLGYVLATSSASGILSTTSSCSPTGTAVGYAVLHGGTNTIRLVRFDNGIHNGTLAVIATSQNVTYSNYHSVRVTYDPATNGWTLQVRSDGTGSFADPAQGTYPSTAAGTDGTHTGVPLNYSGAYFQAGCIGNCEDASSGYIAYFDNVKVDVACTPPPQPGPITGAALVCAQENGTYSIDAVTGALSYQWAYSGAGATLVPTGTSVSVSFASNATSGTLSVSSVGDCPSAPSTLAITVQPLPAAPAITGPVELCAATAQEYTLTPVTGESYAWTLPPGWTGPVTGDNIQVEAVAPGGTLTVTATNACGTGPSSTLAVTVFDAPEVELAAFPLACISHPAFPLTGGTPAGGTYLFNGVPVTSFDPAVGIGSYAITYTFTDANGCSGSATRTLEVGSCAGVPELSSAGIGIHPNPVDQGGFFLEAPAGGQWSLLDVSGRPVAEGSLNPGRRTWIATDGIAPGLHVVLLRTERGAFRSSVMLVR